MVEDKVTLKIRQGSGEQFEVQVVKDCTIAELKTACEEGSKLSADNMRLIFKGKLTVFTNQLLGRILKDEQTLVDFKIEDGQTVHLVKGKTAANAPAS